MSASEDQKEFCHEYITKHDKFFLKVYSQQRRIIYNFMGNQQWSNKGFQTITCSKWTISTIEQSMKSVQNYQ